MAASSRYTSFFGKVYSGTSRRPPGSPNVNSIEVGDSWVRLKKCYCDPKKFYNVRVSGSINNLGSPNVIHHNRWSKTRLVTKDTVDPIEHE